MPLGPVISLAPWNGVLTSGGPPVIFSAMSLTIDTTVQVAKFMMLHLQVDGGIPANTAVSVDLHNGETQEFNSDSGSDFWTMPIAGNTTSIGLTGPATVTVTVKVIEYGHGLVDIFMMGGSGITAPCTHHEDGYHASGGNDDEPAWENVRDLPAGTMRQVANSVGLLVYARPKVTECNNAYSSVIDNATGNALPINYVIGHATASLFKENWILTVAHAIDNCVGACTNEDNQQFLEIVSGAFTLQYELPLGVDTPALSEGNRPKFYKLKAMERTGFRYAADGAIDKKADYAIVEIDVPQHLPTPPTLPTDTANLGNNQELFIIHHPGGLPKQVSRRRISSSSPMHDCRVYLPPIAEPLHVIFDCDCDRGSSGAPVFNVGGSIIGLAKNVKLSEVNNEAPDYIHNWGPRVGKIVDDLQHEDRLQALRIAVVVDVSGSMGAIDALGITKLQELKLALEQFIGLLRATTNTTQQHYVSLVSFNDTADALHQSGDPTILPFTEAARTKFIGSPPYSYEGGSLDTSSLVGSLTAGGSTSIGSGLKEGQDQIDLAPSSKIEAILLMTDGMHNTGTSIEAGEAMLGSTSVRVVGFGSEGSLDGERLFRLANDHSGEYIRAQDGLDLMKFFAVEYGRIFEQGVLQDPQTTIPAGQTTVAPVAINIFYESSITAVVGWDRPDSQFELSMLSPNGQTISMDSPGITAKRGATWTFLRIDFPLNGEHHGQWQILAERQNKSPLRFRGHDTPVLRTTFSPNGTRALSGSAEGDVRLWDVAQARAVRQYMLEDLDNERSRFVVALDYHPNGQMALSGYAYGLIVLWDVTTGQEIRRFNVDNQESPLANAIFSPDGNTIASAHPGAGIKLWDVGKGELINEFPEPRIIDLAYDPTGNILAFIVRRGLDTSPSLGLLDLSISEIQRLEIEDPTKLAYSPTGETVLVGLSSGVLHLYNVENEISLIGILEKHDDNVSGIAYSPNGRFALSCSQPGSNPAIILWDLQTITFIRSFEGHDDDAHVFAVAFHPEGTLALSASADKTLILWDVATGSPAYKPTDFAERFFITSLIQSTVYMQPAKNERHIYTGDHLNPQVILRHVSGARIPAEVTLEIISPTESTGNILAETGLGEARLFMADTLTPRQATLLTLENQIEDRLTTPLIPTQRNEFTLYDDGEHGDGAMEPDGIFGNIIYDMTKIPGTYHLRAIAKFGPAMEFTREATWSLYVTTRIDGKQTDVKTSKNPGQPESFKITFTPKDAYGNFLGPGRENAFTIEPAPGNELLEDVADKGNGEYEQNVTWDGSSETTPGIIVKQPNRPPIILPIPKEDEPQQDDKPQPAKIPLWLWILLLLLVIVIMFIFFI